MTVGYREFPFAGPADFNGLRSGHYSLRDWSGSDDKVHHRAENPYTCTTHVRTDPLLGPNSSGRYLCARALVTPNWDGTPDPWTSNSTIELYNRLGKLVDGHSFNAATFLAESKSALHTITGIASNLYEAARYVRRGNFLEAARKMNLDRAPRLADPSKRFADNWLAYRYGWMPMISDCRDAAIALAALTNRPYRASVRASLTKKGSLANSGDFKRFEHWHGKSIKYYLTEDFKPLSELGFTDPLPTAWEVIPYSFVFDWFIPVGNYLTARSYANRLTGSYVITDRRVRNVFGANLSAPWTAGLRHLEYYWKWHTISRSVGSGGLPNVPIPTLKPLSEAFSWAKAITAVSLITQKRVRENSFSYD